MKREEFKNELKEIFELRADEIESVNERDYPRFKYLRKKADTKWAAVGKRLGVKFYDEDLDIANKKFLRHAKEIFGDDIEDEIIDICENSIERVEDLLDDYDVMTLAADYTIKYYRDLK